MVGFIDGMMECATVGTEVVHPFRGSPANAVGSTTVSPEKETQSRRIHSAKAYESMESTEEGMETELRK